MSILPSPSQPSAAVSGEHADYYRGVLHELIELGTDIARTIHREATADVGEAPVADVTVRFERVCRCVRRSILLARTLDTPAKMRDGQRAAVRRRVVRQVEDLIDHTEEGAEAERLHGELLERLERPELDEDLDSRPVDAVIRDICHDLGLEEVPGFHPWKRRTPADIAVLFQRAKRSPGRSVESFPLTPTPYLSPHPGPAP